MYSGLTEGFTPVTWDLVHIDIDGSFDAGETMLTLTTYKGNAFKKGERYRIFITVNTGFAGSLVETNTWYDSPIETTFNTVDEIALDWTPHSDDCTLQLVNRTADLEITLDWEWTLHQKATLLDNPIDLLYYIRKMQNWEERDINDEPVRYLNTDSEENGSFFHESLDGLRAIKICRQISSAEEATTKAISKSICEEFNLALFTDKNGNESVKALDYLEPDISLNISYDDLMKEPEIIKPDPNRVYCEPVIKLAIDGSTNAATKQFSVNNTDADEYNVSYTPGLTQMQGEPLWTMAKTLRQAVNVVTPHEYTFKYVTDIDDAVQLIARKFVWMSKHRMKFVVSYELGSYLTAGTWGTIILPITTDNKEIRFFVEEVTSSKKRGENSTMVSMQVVLWDSITNDDLEILQSPLHIDNVNGSDTNDGSESHPLKTIEAALEIHKPTQSILLKRGCAFREMITQPKNGTYGRPTVIGAYGTGDKPRLYGSWNRMDPTDWVSVGTNRWKLSNALQSAYTELLSNTSFDSDASGWSLLVDTANGCSASGARDTSVYDTSPASYRIDCTTAGTSWVELYLQSNTMSFEAEKYYKLTFRAKASQSMIIDSVLPHNFPMDIYTEPHEDIAVSTDWNTYELVFKATQTATMQIGFFMGEGMPSGASIWFDTLSVKQTNEMIVDGYFTGDQTNWEKWQLAIMDGFSATKTRDTSVYNSFPASTRIDCTTNGLLVDGIAYSYGPLAIQPEKWYKLSFKAKATAQFTINQIILVGISEPFQLVATQNTNYDITTDWKTYYCYFQSKNHVARGDVLLTFCLGGSENSPPYYWLEPYGLPEGESCWFDNVSFEECKSGACVKHVANIIFNVDTETEHCGNMRWNDSELTMQGDFLNVLDEKTVIMYSVGNPATVYSSIEIALEGLESLIGGWWFIAGIWLQACKNITIQDIDFRHHGAFGINQEDSQNIIQERCDFKWIGGCFFNFLVAGQPYFMRYGNMIQWYRHTKGQIVRYCTFDNCFDTAVTPQSNGEVAYGYDIQVHHNIFKRVQIAFEFWYNVGAIADNFKLENNTFYKIGYGFGGEDRQRFTPTIDYRYLEYAAFNVAYNAATVTRLFVRNNIFCISKKYLFFIEGDKTGDPRPDWTAGLTADGNLYYQESAEDIAISFRNDNYTMAQLADYTEDHGQDANSKANNPGFLDMENEDFHLSFYSEAKNAGLPLGYTTDFDGNPVDESPSMGAYE